MIVRVYGVRGHLLGDATLIEQGNGTFHFLRRDLIAEGEWVVRAETPLAAGIKVASSIRAVANAMCQK